MWLFRERPGIPCGGPYPVHMDKLPPPPPPPPPGRGRQHNPQSDPQHERRSSRPEGDRGQNFNENGGTGRPGAGGALRRWLPWVIAGAFIAVFFIPALMKGGDGNEMTYTEFIDKVQAGQVESVVVE